MPSNAITDYLFTQGVLGVVCAGLIVVVIILYKSNQKKDDRIYEITEARRIDAKETSKEVVDVLQDNAQNIRILSEKIEIGKSNERRR